MDLSESVIHDYDEQIEHADVTAYTVRVTGSVRIG